MTFQAILTVAETTGSTKPEGKFEVFSVITKESLSTPMGWDETWDEFDRIGSGGNAMDVRKVETPVARPTINPLLLAAFR